jgi:8-oxo-dGTP diphosphatase
LKEAQKKRNWRRYLRFRKRRRGTAIIDTFRGILVVSEKGKTYNLPGGAAKDGESRRDAALRELEEETGLKADECSYLFECNGHLQRDKRGGFFRDVHKVFLMRTSGTAKPKNEINYLAYTKDDPVNLSSTTKRIIKKYYKAGVKV